MTLNAKSILLGVSLLTAGAAFNGWWFAWTLGGEIRAVGEKMDRLLEAGETSTDRLLEAQETSTKRLLDAQERSTIRLVDRLGRIQDTLGEVQATLGLIREDQVRILERTPDMP